jgi:5-methylcytosine-specific restriction endonuclease McrA
MSRLGLTRDKIYKTVARQLHGVVPCWVCGEHVLPAAATLEHIQPLSEGGNSHLENLAISHDVCNNQRHATGVVPASTTLPGRVQRATRN